MTSVSPKTAACASAVRDARRHRAARARQRPLLTEAPALDQRAPRRRCARSRPTRRASCRSAGSPRPARRLRGIAPMLHRSDRYLGLVSQQRAQARWSPLLRTSRRRICVPRFAQLESRSRATASCGGNTGRSKRLASPGRCPPSHSLAAAVQRTGGGSYWARVLNMPPPQPARWTDDLLEAELRRVCAGSTAGRLAPSSRALARPAPSTPCMRATGAAGGPTDSACQRSNLRTRRRHGTLSPSPPGRDAASDGVGSRRYRSPSDEQLATNIEPRQEGAGRWGGD